MTREEAIKRLKTEIDDYIPFKDKWDGAKEDVEALDMAIKALEQDPRWIPVSERLPEDGCWELFTNGKQISIERYKHDALDHFYPSGRFFNFEDAVAWMPLPPSVWEKEINGREIRC